MLVGSANDLWMLVLFRFLMVSQNQARAPSARTRHNACTHTHTHTYIHIGAYAQGFGLGGNLAVDFSLFMEFVPSNVRGKMTILLTVSTLFSCVYVCMKNDNFLDGKYTLLICICMYE